MVKRNKGITIKAFKAGKYPSIFNIFYDMTCVMTWVEWYMLSRVEIIRLQKSRIEYHFREE